MLDESEIAGPAATPEPSVVTAPLDPAALDVLFRTARTSWAWRDTPVSDETLRELYDLVKLGPTSANCSPARFMFLRTADAKRTPPPRPLGFGNVDKTMAAPVVCIVAHDPKFYEDLPRLYPAADARAWFANNEDLASTTAFRNGTLQGSLPDPRCPRPGPRLRPHVRLRQREGRQRIPSWPPAGAATS